MGAQPDSRLVQLSAPRQKEFALRREDINECFLEFTIEPGEVVLFSHVDSSVSRAGILLQAKSQVGIHHGLFMPLDGKLHAMRHVQPNFLAQLLELLADQRSQQQPGTTLPERIASLLSRVCDCESLGERPVQTDALGLAADPRPRSRNGDF